MLSRLVFYGRTNMKIGESAGMIKSILAAASELLEQIAAVPLDRARQCGMPT